MKRKLKATPRFIMLLTLICLIFAGAVILSQQAKLNEIAAKQAALDEQYAALQAEEQRLEYMIEYAKSAHDAINAAIADVQAGRTGPIPRQLQNKHFDGEDAAVKGQNYKYAHDYENHWVDQQYLPDLLKDVKYYTFGDNRTEQAARAYWAKIKGEDKL